MKSLNDELRIQIQEALNACNDKEDFDSFLASAKNLEKIIAKASGIPSKSDKILKEGRGKINELKKQGFLSKNRQPPIIYTGAMESNRRKH